LAQLSVPEKTNEITAIPDLLDQLAETKQLEDALVIIDTMGCQVQIAEIVAHKADGGAVRERRTPDVILVIKPW
jgi:predicted transposase YbfD/YdcC